MTGRRLPNLELRASAPVGAPATSPACVSSLNLAAGREQRPAVLSGEPTADELRALLAKGLVDREIGALYGRNVATAAWWRQKHGIPGQGYGARGESLAAPLPTAADDFAAKLAALGGYTDITAEEMRALHRKRPIGASLPVSRHPPTQWIPREAMT